MRGIADAGDAKINLLVAIRKTVLHDVLLKRWLGKGRDGPGAGAGMHQPIAGWLRGTRRLLDFARRYRLPDDGDKFQYGNQTRQIYVDEIISYSETIFCILIVEIQKSRQIWEQTLCGHMQL